MKNKKVARTLTAIVLTAAMAAPITASATLGPEGGTVSGEDVSQEQRATTSVELDAEAMYIVTIPATISLRETAEGSAIYQGNNVIKANSVHLNEGQRLKVTLQSNFKLRAGQNELTYIAAKKDSFESTIENNGVVGYFAATAGDAADEELPIYFKTTTELTYAGTYTDTVTFSFEQVPNE